MNKQQKAEIIKKFQKSPKDTGSAPAQAALLTAKIKELTGHFKIHKKDFHSQRGLLKTVSRRKKLLTYIKRANKAEWESLLARLNLRKQRSPRSKN